MKTFENYIKTRLDCREFQSVYQRECHVCAHTVRIFEQLEKAGETVIGAAQRLQVDPRALEALEAADYCDPRLVMRLCRELGLPVPAACPRLSEPSDRSEGQ